MTQKPKTLRIAAVALFASVVLPSTPVTAQDVPVVTPPPPVLTPPPPVTTTPRPPVSVAPPTVSPQPTITPRPTVTPPLAAPPRTTPAPVAERPAARTPRAAPRQPARRAETTVRRAAPTPAPVAEPVVADPLPAPAPAPEAVLPPPALEPVPVDPAPVAEPAESGTNWLPIAGGIVLALAALAFLIWALRRRRADDEVYQEDYEAPAYAAPAYDEPVIAPAYAAAAPLAEEPAIAAPADADVEALAAASEPEAGRPWLEFLMRPVRAGTSEDETRVEFELTIGNTGSVPARDVRVSTWMFAAGESDMERELIEPANAQHSEVDIEPGDGARVEGAIALPTAGLRGKVLPVVVADARYRLPDGSEGRTSASFAVGLPNGDSLEPFAVDLPSGLTEDIDVRLHGEPQRT